LPAGSEPYLLGAYLLGALASSPKVLLPNKFIVLDRDLAECCQPLADIPEVQRPRDDPLSPYGIGGGSFWMQIGDRE
jgi:hypothetical protein